MTYHVRRLAALLLSLLLLSCAGTESNIDLIQMRKLKDQAFSGNPESQYQLGLHYTLNKQWAWDNSRGYQWFYDAAEQGHPDAQYMVGMGKLLGRGTSEDKQGAVYWLEKSAKQGQLRAQYQLGQAYLHGDGVNKDQAWGRQWLERAGQQGHKEAQFLLGALFNKGIGGKPNRAEAWAWLKTAANNEHEQAKTVLVKLTKELSATEKESAEQIYQQRKVQTSKQLFTRPLKRYLQTALNRSGYLAGAEDGIIGPVSQSAINHYLADKNLPRDTQQDKLIEHLRGNL